MALTIVYKDGETNITPLRLDYAKYNDPKHNAFFQKPARLKSGLKCQSCSPQSRGVLIGTTLIQGQLHPVMWWWLHSGTNEHVRH